MKSLTVNIFLFCQNHFLIIENSCQNIKTRKHTGMRSGIKFQGLILRKKHICIVVFGFLRQSSRNATRGILNFTDRAIRLESLQESRWNKKIFFFF